MNFKERIDTINKIKSETNSSIEIKSDVEVFDIFVKNKTVEHILKNAIAKSKNIIFVCQSACDRTVVSNYARTLIDNSIAVEIVNNLSGDLPFVSASSVIVPEPSSSEVVKIFELIMYDFKSFIFSINLKSFCNVLESLRTLISLNKLNLTPENVEHLIGISEALLVYVSRNDDGLFAITDIGKIVYKNNKMFLDVLYGSNDVELNDISLNNVQAIEEDVLVSDVSEKIVVSESIVEQNLEVEKVQNLNIEAPKSELEELDTDKLEAEKAVVVNPESENKEIADKVVVSSETEKDEIEKSEIENSEAEKIEVEQPSKVNKYKLLKEKRKSKKQLEE